MFCRTQAIILAKVKTSFASDVRGHDGVGDGNYGRDGDSGGGGRCDGAPAPCASSLLAACSQYREIPNCLDIIWRFQYAPNPQNFDAWPCGKHMDDAHEYSDLPSNIQNRSTSRRWRKPFLFAAVLRRNPKWQFSLDWRKRCSPGSNSLLSPSGPLKWYEFLDLSEACSRFYRRRFLKLKTHSAAFFQILQTYLT